MTNKNESDNLQKHLDSINEQVIVSRRISRSANNELNSLEAEQRRAEAAVLKSKQLPESRGVNFYISSDYAGASLSLNGVSFYYGYETAEKLIDSDGDEYDGPWMFESEFNGIKESATAEQLGCPDSFNCHDVLIRGILWVINKHGIGGGNNDRQKQNDT